MTLCFQKIKKNSKQIFFPLALVALFVLLPVNILGQGVKQGVLSSAAAAAAAAKASNSSLAFHSPAEAKAAAKAAAPPGFTSFSRFTLTNLPQGSPFRSSVSTTRPGRRWGDGGRTSRGEWQTFPRQRSR